MMSRFHIGLQDSVDHSLWKRIAAFFLISAVALMVLNDAYNIKNGWIHPETVVWSVKYLMDDTHEKIGLSFNIFEELKRVFWWEQFIDSDVDGGQTRLLTAAFGLIDIKFRTWLFQYLPPHPAISLSWIFTLFLIPLLLFRFLRMYIKLGVIGSAVVTVSFLASPATGSLTFFNFHHGKMLSVFFIVLTLNICIWLNDLSSFSKNQNNKKIGILILLGISLFLSLYSDSLVFVMFLLIPLFFPRLLGNIFRGGFSPVLSEETGKKEIGKNLWANFLNRIKQADYKSSILPTFAPVVGAYISLAIAYYSYKKWIGYIIKASLPSDIKPTVRATLPWIVLIALAFYFFVFSLRSFIKRFSAADLVRLFKRYVAEGSNRYFLLLVYVIVAAAYLFSVFFIIPKIADWAGYHYKCLYLAYFVKTNVGGGAPSPFYQYLISPKFYLTIIVNIYWFVTGGIGLRDYLPLYYNLSEANSLIITYRSIAAFLLVHIIIIGLGAVCYKISSKNKQVIIALIAVYATSIWIVFIHTLSSRQYFYLPYSNFFYGAIFSVFMAIFLGAVLASFAGHKRIYIAIMIIILISSSFTYKNVKEINLGWKGGHYRGNDIDGFYKEYKEYWKEIKNNKKNFDTKICSSIDNVLHYSIVYRDALLDYGAVQHGATFNKEYMKSVSFAAFCGDNYLKTSDGLLDYKPYSLEKVALTQEQIETSSSNETRHQAIDGSRETFWHVKYPKEEKVDAFIEIDIGRKRFVKALRILPRLGSIDQLWVGRHGVWEGSDNGDFWQAITALRIAKTQLKDGLWTGFALPANQAYRYYRLRIRNQAFLSLAEIELYSDIQEAHK